MGQTVTLVGAKSNDTVQTGDKFRVTWRWTLSEFGGGAFFDVRRFDLNVQEALPGMGFIPVSSPAANQGDEVIVYDVKLSQAWGSGNKNVADVAAALDKLPFTTDLALDVSRVEKVSASATSAELAAGQAKAREQGNVDSAKDRASSGINPFKELGGWLDKLGTITVVAVVGIAAVVAYTYYAKR